MNIIGNGGHAKVVREVATLTGLIYLSEEYVFVAVGDNAARKKEALSAAGIFVPLIHPKATYSQDCNIGDGTIIMAGAIVQPGCKIGKHCILNTSCSLDHDCIIGDYVHIAPGAHLCGGVQVGEGALVGVGVGIAPGAVIPEWSIVKAARLDIERMA